MQYVLILDGEPNTGKTSTLSLLIDEIERITSHSPDKEYVWRESKKKTTLLDVTNNPTSDKDKCVYFDLGQQNTILIATSGDKRDLIEVVLKEVLGTSSTLSPRFLILASSHSDHKKHYRYVLDRLEKEGKILGEIEEITMLETKRNQGSATANVSRIIDYLRNRNVSI